MNEKGTQDFSSTHIPLTSVSGGNTCRLIGVTRGRGLRGKHEKNPHRHRQKEYHDDTERRVMKRLLDLGLTKGCTFKVIQSRGRGPVLLEVRGTRIALGHGLASKLMVELVEGTN